jgi:ATP-dependent Clp protease ATP-binding subunit ClpA
MSDYNHELIGPAALVLGAARQLVSKSNPVALLIEGDPGVGKGHISDQLALELTGSRFAIEQINGQSLSVDVVRLWKERCGYGNLFSDRTVKRIDELDHTSSSAMAELLTHLDYLHKGHAIIATTNEFAKLRTQSKGRLESRFVRFHVDAPSVEQTAAFVQRLYKLPAAHARAIALGAVPEGCLPSVGCNLRTAINDAKGLTAAKKARAA